MTQRANNILGWIPPSHPEGQKFWGTALIAAVIALLFGCTVLGLCLFLLSACIYAFFRDPARSVPQADDCVLSPADGVVCQITDIVPPADLDLGHDMQTRVSIFMSVFDVHINRAPIQGQVRKMVYVPGKFLNADLDKASEDNERHLYTIRTEQGVDIGFIQIAGLIARRIVPFVREGDRVLAGERVGLIRFGSRVDLYLPKGSAPKVALGQRCTAGETVLAKLGDVQTISTITR